MLGFTLTSLVSEGQELLWDWATTNDGGSLSADSEHCRSRQTGKERQLWLNGFIIQMCSYT
ncbi:unnamed protein product, partial [Ixodes persulcatus]